MKVSIEVEETTLHTLKDLGSGDTWDEIINDICSELYQCRNARIEAGGW